VIRTSPYPSGASIDSERLVLDIEAACSNVHRYTSHTPLIRAPYLDRLIRGEVHLKAECLQPTGSFKIRGALHAMSQLRASGQQDVVAFSSGNHGIGVAYAAHCLNMRATIVVPSDIPRAKLAKIRSLGADVVFYDRERESREAIATALCAHTEASIVKPYDDWDTIAGQGTCGVEIKEQLSLTPDSLLVCTGGGGFAAGTGTYLRRYYPELSIITAEPEGWDDHLQSFQVGKRSAAAATTASICDGLLAPEPGEITFVVNQHNRAQGMSASDDLVRRAMKLIWEQLGVGLEPSGAIGVASLLAQPERFSEQIVVITLSGGNVDRDRFDEALNLAR